MSLRGRVLPRQQAPRHPPCAHLRGLLSPHSPYLFLTEPRSRPGPLAAPDRIRPAQPTFIPPHTPTLCLPHAPPAGLGVCAPTRTAGAVGPRLSIFPRQRSLPGRVVSSARGPEWSRGDSNPGPPPCKGGALPAKLRPRWPRRPGPPVVGAPGLEPGTSVLSGPRSHHLSYAPTPGQTAGRSCAEDGVKRGPTGLGRLAPRPRPRSGAPLARRFPDHQSTVHPARPSPGSAPIA